jgi:hypothetical protein
MFPNESTQQSAAVASWHQEAFEQLGAYRAFVSATAKSYACTCYAWPISANDMQTSHEYACKWCLIFLCEMGQEALQCMKKMFKSTGYGVVFVWHAPKRIQCWLQQLLVHALFTRVPAGSHQGAGTNIRTWREMRYICEDGAWRQTLTSYKLPTHAADSGHVMLHCRWAHKTASLQHNMTACTKKVFADSHCITQNSLNA